MDRCARWRHANTHRGNGVEAAARGDGRETGWGNSTPARKRRRRPERGYEPAVQVAEIMLILATVNDPPLVVVVLVVEAVLDGDGEDELLGDVEVLDDDDELSVAPEKRPVTIT